MSAGGMKRGITPYVPKKQKILGYVLEIPSIGFIQEYPTKTTLLTGIRQKYIASQRLENIELIGEIEEYMAIVTPVRSGKLLQHIYDTMALEPRKFSKTQWYITLSYNVPGDRGLEIDGHVAHSYPDTGRGDIYPLTSPLVMNIVRIDVLDATKKGNAVFYLNDTKAVNNYVEQSLHKICDELIQDFTTFFQGFKITVKL